MFFVTPGMASMRTFPVAISTTWIIHAPTTAKQVPKGHYKPNATQLSHIPLRLTHSALMLAYAAWSRASSLELSTCSTLRILFLRRRVLAGLFGCRERPGSLMLGGLGPLMVVVVVVAEIG